MWLFSAAGLLALLVDINALAQLVSIGTLFVFFMVSAGVLQVHLFQVLGFHGLHLTKAHGSAHVHKAPASNGMQR
jgi:hypothetical protein